MNKEANNDIDILLRKLSRRDGSVPSAAHDGRQNERAHLDADELNAYAENALPSALRARYTEHLTECTNCRKIVTQLSLASAVVVHERVEEAKPTALKKLLATLFSPMVFRYAVPAMAIVVVAAIAWVALQRSPRNAEIAQNMASESRAPATKTEAESNSSASVGQPKATSSDPKEVPARAAEKAAAPPEPSESKRQEANEEVKKGADVAVADLRDREDQSRRNQQQPVAPVTSGVGGATTGAAAPASPKPAIVTEQQNVAAAQKKEAEADKSKAMNEPAPRQSVSGPQKSPEPKSSPDTTTYDTTESRGARRELSRAKDDVEAGETRTVGGHRFRKRGDVWIDTLYSSQRITNVSRGSEQYRALVADEPGIRSIADQLKTQFIVVWNGRAYFIK